MVDPYALIGHFVFGMLRAWGIFLAIYLLIRLAVMLYEKIKDGKKDK